MANKESLELANLVVSSVSAAGEALKDGKIDLLDAVLLLKPLMAAGAALDNVSGVLDEVKSWSSAEREQVLAKLREIDLPDDEKEKLIEKGLQALVLIAEVVLPLIKLKG